ncbi:MAG: DUF1501 domain-containing protein, partial [Hymenobacter sp.]
MVGAEPVGEDAGVEAAEIELVAQVALAGDLQQSHEWENTLVLVFSEFGRRVSQNASNGTDHGT